MSELSEDIVLKIEQLSEEGNHLFDGDDFNGAFEKFMKGLELLPQPINQWPEATWLFAALGDVYFFTEDYEMGLKAFSDAVDCPEGLGNPFIHLRLGQCAYELGDLGRAADELTRAFMSDGEEIFEDEDRKYFDFLKTKIKV